MNFENTCDVKQRICHLKRIKCTSSRLSLTKVNFAFTKKKVENDDVKKVVGNCIVLYQIQRDDGKFALKNPEQHCKLLLLHVVLTAHNLRERIDDKKEEEKLHNFKHYNNT